MTHLRPRLRPAMEVVGTRVVCEIYEAPEGKLRRLYGRGLLKLKVELESLRRLQNSVDYARTFTIAPKITQRCFAQPT